MTGSSMIRKNLSSRFVARGQRGVALLEVMIAFFVLSIGLLGLAGLQIKALQFNQSAYQRSQAIASTYDMLDRMRLNRQAATGNQYDTGGWQSQHTGSGNIVDADLTQWLTAISGNLPDGQGSIVCDANDVCTVSVRWSNRFQDDADPGDDFEEFSLTSEM